MENTVYTWNAETLLAAKVAAVALAEFWDAMSTEEGDKEKSFDNTQEVISFLAAACNAPPSTSDLDDEEVTAALNDLLEEE